MVSKRTRSFSKLPNLPSPGRRTVWFLSMTSVHVVAQVRKLGVIRAPLLVKLPPPSPSPSRSPPFSSGSLSFITAQLWSSSPLTPITPFALVDSLPSPWHSSHSCYVTRTIFPNHTEASVRQVGGTEKSARKGEYLPWGHEQCQAGHSCQRKGPGLELTISLLC